MKKSRLIELLSSADEEYVAIEVDGQLYGISEQLGHEDEQFDGFDTAYPAMAILKPIDDLEEL